MTKNLKMIRPKSTKFLGLASVLILAVLLLFQNCADTGPEQKDNSSFGDSAPFPFDATLDTISYMSCSGLGGTGNPRAYYTFRAGAYQNNNGIGINQNFLNQITGAEQRVDIIQSAPSNAGSYLQLAVRSQAHYQTVLGGLSSPQEGVHYYNFMDTLSSPVIADRLGKLTDANTKINYFGGVSGLEGRFVEGSLRFFDGEGQSNSVRSRIMNENFALSLTYSLPGGDGFTARAPNMSDPRKVYGRSYAMTFKLWGNQTAGINRLLNSIVERDAQTGGVAGTWTCDMYDSYVIFRPQDIGGCPVTADPRGFPNTAQGQKDRARLEKIRRVLRVEDWWVNLNQGCVVPKNSSGGSGGSCYGSQSTIYYAAGSGGSGITACDANTCPHYVSVCTRN